MHAGRKFTLKEVLIWTRREILVFLIIATIPTTLRYFFDLDWLVIPWLPIAVVGTVVTFLVGFKNNAIYDRLWEARKIWGAIVNDSRTWGIMARDYVTNRVAKVPGEEVELESIHRKLVYRHMAWLTALRYQLREPKVWENANPKTIY